MLSSLAAAMAIVCPPASKEATLKENLKLEGATCGGACDTEGICGAGLSCVVPKPPPLSFAILLTPDRPGVCTSTKTHLLGEDPATYAPKPHLLGEDSATWGPAKRSMGMVGGVSPADVNDKTIIDAAKACTQWMVRSSNSLTPPTFSRLVSATQQVVAGINYHLEIEMSDGSTHAFDVHDTPWLDASARYEVTKHTPK